MHRHRKSLLVVVWLALLQVGLAVAYSVERAGAQTAPSASGSPSQVFSVALHLEPAPVDARGRCSQPEERAEVEGIKFQFILSPSSSPPTLTVMPSELPSSLEAYRAKGASVALMADGSDWVFDSVDVRTNWQMTLSQGRLHLTDPQAAGAAPELEVSHVRVKFEILHPPDVPGLSCTSDATGTGVLDHSPPIARFDIPCTDSPADPCELLPDTEVAVAFSKSVQLDEARTRIGAVADDGTPVPLLPVSDATPSGYLLRFRGAWPLSQQVTFRLAAGVHDLANNTTTQTTEQRFPVVSDPGDLDDAENPGFETSDLIGYTVRRLPCPYTTRAESPPDRLCGSAPPTAPEVIADFHGIAPTEGRWMLAAGTLLPRPDSDFRSAFGLPGGSGGCSLLVLTARLHVPSDATSLVLDDNFVLAAKESSPFDVPLRASLGGRGDIQTAEQPWPSANTFMMADGQTVQTGWQQIRIPVGTLVGSTAVLTLHLQPFRGPRVPNACTPGVLLLDNLHFE